VSIHKFILTASAAFCLAGSAYAGLATEEIKALGTTLTEFGAEKAASANGAIPAYTGGIKAAPADFVPGSGRYTDPYKDEKPLYTISAANMRQYAQLLTPASKALLERFPTYKMNVYKTHRSMIYPDWVLKNTLKNATTARMVGEGDGVEGAFGGIPFPIPKTGYEVMWNNYLRFQGATTDLRFRAETVDRSGQKTVIAEQETSFMFPYYDRKTGKMDDTNYMTIMSKWIGPPSQAGLMILQKFSMNYALKDDATWMYSPGQRRVRVMPEAKYDTPATPVGGTMFYEEINAYNGRMDRFDYKIVGKQEMLVPYNNYRAYFSPDTNSNDKHENPDVIRWELHRVWVVEGNLKKGKRHAYSKRVFYIDEDSWAIMQSESYDQAGKLYRVLNNLSFIAYDKPRIIPASGLYYDLNKGSYTNMAFYGAAGTRITTSDEVPAGSRYTAQTMGNMGVR
jgi:hypothetical protein